MNKKLIKSLFGILFAVVSVALTALLFRFEFFQSLERKAYDAMMTARGERENTRNVVIVKIDEYSIKELDYPIPRDKYGTLLAILAQSGALAIGVDDLFPTIKQDSVSLAQNDQFLLFHNYAPNVYHAIGPFIPSGVDPGSTLTIDDEAYYSLHQHSIPANGAEFPFPIDRMIPLQIWRRVSVISCSARIPSTVSFVPCRFLSIMRETSIRHSALRWHLPLRKSIWKKY